MRRLILTLTALTITIGAADLVAAKPPKGFGQRSNNVYVHKASGALFPAEVAGFTRSEEHGLDPKGHDVGITYRTEIDGKPVVTHVALVHVVGMTPHDHFTAMKSLVGDYFADDGLTRFRLAGDGPYTPPKLKPLSGWQGRFSALHGKERYGASLSTVRFGKYWSARMTAAYPTALSPQAQVRLNALATALLSNGPRHRG
jgi:hypothetical protein